MLGDFQDQSVVNILDFECVQNWWNLSVELHIDHSTDDLRDLSLSESFSLVFGCFLRLSKIEELLVPWTGFENLPSQHVIIMICSITKNPIKLKYIKAAFHQLLSLSLLLPFILFLCLFVFILLCFCWKLQFWLLLGRLFLCRLLDYGISF